MAMSITVAQRFRACVHRAANELGQGHVQRDRPAIAQLLHIVELVQLQHSRSLSGPADVRPASKTITRNSSRGRRQLSSDAAVAAEIPLLDYRKRQSKLMEKFCNIWSSFFESDLYQAWRDGTQWHLCCHGEPGCGKSTLAAAVADDLTAFYSGRDAVIIVLFLDEKDRKRRKRIYEMPEISPLSALRLHILKQIMEFRGSAHGASALIASDALKRLIMPQLAQGLSDLLDAEIERLSNDRRAKLFFIVDGLDRCPPEVETSYLQELARLQGMVMVTRSQPMSESNLKSCDVTDCESREISLYFQCRECEPLPSFDVCLPCHRSGYVCPKHGSAFREPYQDRGFELRTLDRHIAQYVREQVRTELLSIPFGQQLSQSQDLMEQIEETITTRASGVLVIARAWIDYIIQQQQVHELLDTLAHIAEPEQQYFETLMRRVEQQPQMDRELALLSLQLVTRALGEARRRSITYEELVEALKLGEHHLKSQAHLLLICQSTIGISDTYSRIEPFHEELATWLNENWLRSQPKADMADTCLRSIWRSIERLDGRERIYDAAQTCLEEDRLLAYALQSWGYHFAQYQSEAAWAQIMSLMSHESALRNYATLLCLSDSNGSATLDLWPGCQPIHFCAFFGSVEVFDRLKNENQDMDVNAVDSIIGRTALIIACQNGHVAFVQRLLQLGAKATMLCKRGRSAILEAIDHENQGIFDLLLPAQNWNNTMCASDDDKKHFGKAVNLASEKQDPHYLHDLLRVRSKDLEVHENGLSMKCLSSGCLETLRCLVDSPGLDWNYQNEDGETLLHVAARTSIENLRFVVDSLRKLGLIAACAQRTTSSGKTPAMLSLRYLGADAHEALRLLRCSPTSNAIADERGRTILHHAAEYDRHGTCLKLLSEEGVALDVIDNLGWSPLHVACCSWNPVAAATLLEFGARAELVDKNGRTASDVARLYDPADDAGIALQIAQYLPCRSLDAVPFWSQFRSRSDADVQSLSSVSQGELSAVEPNTQNNLLHWATAIHDQQKLELLLEDGRIDVNARNADGHTPLSLHCTGFEGPSVEIVELLLTHGAEYHLCKIRAVDLLDTAIEAGCIDVAMIFIERCDALSSTDVDPQVLLQHAINIDNLTAAEKLLDHGAKVLAGAKVLVHDMYGRLPIQQAKETPCSEQMITTLERYSRHEIDNMYPLTPQLFASPDLRSESPPPDGKSGRSSPHQNRQDSYADFWTNRPSQ